MKPIGYQSQVGLETIFWGQKNLKLKYFPQSQISLKGFYPKNSLVYGFTVPWNVSASSKNNFLNHFNIWENENGIALKGKCIDNSFFVLAKSQDPPFKITVASIISQTPIFVGDFTQKGDSIIAVNGSFNEKTKLWKCLLTFGNLPKIPTINDDKDDPKTDNLYFRQIETTLNSVLDSLNKVHSAFKTSQIIAPSSGGTCAISVVNPPQETINILKNNITLLKEKEFKNA